MTLASTKPDEAMLIEVYPLLKKMIEGEDITQEERAWLGSLRYIKHDTADLSANNDMLFTDSHLSLLVSLIPKLQWLDLDGTQVSDLSTLEQLSELRQLDLRSTQISDLSPLAALKNLRKLVLHSTKISDVSQLGRLKELESLSLAYTQVSDLTSLSDLPNLSQLNICGTQVNNLAPLSCLKKLSFLNSSYTQISDLTPLRELTKLKRLDLKATQINDLTPLSGLKRLNYLSLESTQVSELDVLSDLSELHTLSLNHTLVTDLSALRSLTNLESLYLSHVQISDLTPIANLISLRYLCLDSTKVRNLTPIEKLTKLRQLDLKNLFLDTIPRSFVREDLELRLNGAVLYRQPAALFHLSTKQILSMYYDEDHKKINEGKVIFLGDPAVGKTHTIQRILSGGIKKEYDTKSTPGVDIRPFEFNGGTNIRFWDFGGQEIMQSMHHCFLTERTCYVVVVNNRTSESPISQARKWLRTVAGFSQQVSVLLLVNQWSSVAAESTIDSGELKIICPALADVVFYSAADDTQEQFNRRVTERIRQEVAKLDSVKLELPKSWADIREDMLKMQIPYISVKEYRDICSHHGLSGNDRDSESIRMWLLEWFNDMGICFSYHKNAPIKAKKLRDYKVLQPKWLTEGIYRIIYNGSQCTASGFVHHNDLRSMLLIENDSYLAVDKSIYFKKDDFTYILEVMRKFGRSFNYGDEREFIPETLSSQRPENPEPREQSFNTLVTYTLKLTYLPLGLLHHLMIVLFSNCDGLIWRRGMRLRNEDTVLLIEGEPELPLVHFHLYRKAEQAWDYCPLFHQARRIAF